MRSNRAGGTPSPSSPAILKMVAGSPQLSLNEIDFARRALLVDARADGRRPLEARPATFTLGPADGMAEVRAGGKRVCEGGERGAREDEIVGRSCGLLQGGMSEVRARERERMRVRVREGENEAALCVHRPCPAEDTARDPHAGSPQLLDPLTPPGGEVDPLRPSSPSFFFSPPLPPPSPALSAGAVGSHARAGGGDSRPRAPLPRPPLGGLRPHQRRVFGHGVAGGPFGR